MRGKMMYRWLLYGAGLGVLVAIMAWVKYRFVVMDHAVEVYALFIGVVFVVLGAWLGSKLVKPKTIIKEEIVVREVMVPMPAAGPVPSGQLSERMEAMGISQREMDVLQLLAKGMSNEEIAAGLYVSQNTVKTHLSNLYFKLDVKRRTQAVERARVIGLID
jgi:DNA-binding CsgD family transcriptional regulator